MIKQPKLPLKWYNENGEQQFLKLVDTVAKDYYILEADSKFMPPFEIKRDTRVDAISQLDLIRTEDGAVFDLLTHDYPGALDIKTSTITEDGIATVFDWIVYNGFPFTRDHTTWGLGIFYMILSDGIETWYSEYFRLCDLRENILNTINWTNNGFNSVVATADGVGYIRLTLCEFTGNGGAVDCDETFDIIYNEPVEFFDYSFMTVAACGVLIDYGDSVVAVLIETATGLEVSNRIALTEGLMHEYFIPTKTCTANIHLSIAIGLFARQDHAMYLWNKKLSGYSILEWNDVRNFCSTIYVDDSASVNYINQLFIPIAKPINPTYNIEETAEEDDEKNHYKQISTLQKYFKMDLAGGHHLTDALAFCRLNSEITFYLETGEVIDAMDFSMTNSPITEYCDSINLQWREKSCSRDCGFDADIVQLMAYNGTDGAGVDYRIGIAQAKSYQNYQFTKSARNPIISPVGATWEHDNVKDPCLIYVNGTYYIYYTGFSLANTNQIGVATSPDGFNWTKFGANPVVTFVDVNNIHRFPTVYYDTNEANPAKVWKMWYTDENWDIGYAYSPDGYVWTKFAVGNPVLTRGAGGSWDDANIIPGCIYYKDGTWYLYYSGKDGGAWGVGLATFTDPEGAYTKDAGNPLIAGKGTSSSALTLDLTTGNKIVTIADTTLFEVNEYVWFRDDNTIDPELNRVFSIDSATKLTLYNNAANDFTVAQNALIRSAYNKSIYSRSIWNDGVYCMGISLFQVWNDLGVSAREQSALARSDSLDSGWEFDYDVGLMLQPGGAADWDRYSYENPSVIQKIKNLPFA